MTVEIIGVKAQPESDRCAVTAAAQCLRSQFRDSRSLRSALTNKRKLVERGLTFMTLGAYLSIPKLRRHRRCVVCAAPSSALLTWRNYLTL